MVLTCSAPREQEEHLELQLVEGAASRRLSEYVVQLRVLTMGGGTLLLDCHFTFRDHS